MKPNSIPKVEVYNPNRLRDERAQIKGQATRKKNRLKRKRLNKIKS